MRCAQTYQQWQTQNVSGESRLESAARKTLQRPGEGDSKLLRVPFTKPPHWGLLFVGNGLPLGFYFPRPGDVLICDYSTGFIAPEMVKRRPVVVVSGRERHGRKLCTVVPLSTTDPVPVEAWHHCLPVAIPGWNAAMCWAKCDMLATVSFDRLDKPHSKTRHGRTYHTVRLSPTDLLAVRQGVLSYLHF